MEKRSFWEHVALPRASRWCPQVSRHLSKLFDSLCKLKFQLGPDGKALKTGLGMYSKEDEYVAFDQDCDLSGQVRQVAWGSLLPALQYL